MLDAKLRVVPEMHTNMSLILMFRRSMLTGLRRVLNLQKRMRTIKLFKKPKNKINPRKTATTVCPFRESPARGSTGSVGAPKLRLYVQEWFISDFDGDRWGQRRRMPCAEVLQQFPRSVPPLQVKSSQDSCDLHSAEILLGWLRRGEILYCSTGGFSCTVPSQRSALQLSPGQKNQAITSNSS